MMTAGVYDDLSVALMADLHGRTALGDVVALLDAADDRFAFAEISWDGDDGDAEPLRRCGFAVIAGDGEAAVRAVGLALRAGCIPVARDCPELPAWFPSDWRWREPREAADLIGELRRTPEAFRRGRAAVRGLREANLPPPSSAERVSAGACGLAGRFRASGVGIADFGSVAAFLKTIRVAAIMDEFTWRSYSPEADMIQLTPEGYAAQLETFTPELIFVESAWRGVDGKWKNAIHRLPDELLGILRWAGAHRVPTVFWNKEDPIHFDTFKDVAVLFDFIFTYDLDCVQRYRSLTGRNNAFFLPMAVQPAMFSPVERYVRKDAFCFAGSYYRRYPERARDMDGFIREFSKVKPVEIYDRQYGKDDPNYMMPPEYAPYVRGNLPYDQIDRAYKGYSVAINLNSIKQANSVARRVFELLASNTLTVSNYSHGVATAFGDLVITSDRADVILGRMREYEAQPHGLDRLRLLGLRKVFSGNTYADRFAYVCSKILGVDLTGCRPRVAVVARVSDESELRRVRTSFGRQSYANRELVVLSDRAHPVAGTLTDAASLLDRLAHADYVGAMHPDDGYAAHYLDDLVCGFRYAATEAVGKGSYYAAGAGGTVLRTDRAAYAAMPGVELRRGLVRTAAFLAGLGQEAGRLPGVAPRLEVPALSLDPFNYCEGAGTASPDAAFWREIADLEGVDGGFDIPSLQRRAEALRPLRMGETADLPRLKAEDLFACSGNAKCDGVACSFGNGRTVLRSSLERGAHVYFPIGRTFPRAELPLADGRLLLHLETGGPTSVASSVAYYFLDARRNKIGSALGPTNANLTVDLPPETAFVRFGIRLMGAGTLEVGDLTFAHKATPLPPFPDRCRVLCLANHYPSYDDLYRNAFVHARVLGYAGKGLRMSVFRMSDSPQVRFEEFEGVTVVSGNADYLRFILAANGYAAIVVHFLNEEMWDVLRELPRTTRILVWSHGADILTYRRRLFNYRDERALERARLESEVRSRFWRSILTDVPANYTHVFVSDYLKSVVERDFGLKMPIGKHAVIHNPVDTAFFACEPKDPALRYKVLSIRPFASRKYANDLSVKCILELAKRPDFDRFTFTVVGDGPLFDETVGPLRGYGNVRLVRKFLRREEIRALHRENGVFLVPTREDTQGVSRDEAMSSGLVPVTNGVTAVPEFVDETCGILAPEEDFAFMARKIGEMADRPELFAELSRNAAARVRRQSAADLVVSKELALICGDAPEGLTA